MVYAYTDYEDYVGSTYQKHIRLIRLHAILAQALRNPPALIYPQAKFPGIPSPTASIGDEDLASVDQSGQLKITPKTLRKCLQAIKEFNFSYSILTP